MQRHFCCAAGQTDKVEQRQWQKCKEQHGPSAVACYQCRKAVCPGGICCGLCTGAAAPVAHLLSSCRTSSTDQAAQNRIQHHGCTGGEQCAAGWQQNGGIGSQTGRKQPAVTQQSQLLYLLPEHQIQGRDPQRSQKGQGHPHQAAQRERSFCFHRVHFLFLLYQPPHRELKRPSAKIHRKMIFRISSTRAMRPASTSTVSGASRIMLRPNIQ